MSSKSIMRKNQNWASFVVKHKSNTKGSCPFWYLTKQNSGTWQVLLVNTKLQPEHFCSAAVLSWMPCPRSHPWNLILDYRFELNLLDRICSKMYFGCAVATLYLWVEWKVAWCNFLICATFIGMEPNWMVACTAFIKIEILTWAWFKRDIWIFIFQLNTLFPIQNESKVCFC